MCDSSNVRPCRAMADSSLETPNESTVLDIGRSSTLYPCVSVDWGVPLQTVRDRGEPHGQTVIKLLLNASPSQAYSLPQPTFWRRRFRPWTIVPGFCQHVHIRGNLGNVSIQELVLSAVTPSSRTQYMSKKAQNIHTVLRRCNRPSFPLGPFGFPAVLKNHASIKLQAATTQCCNTTEMKAQGNCSNGPRVDDLHFQKTAGQEEGDAGQIFVCLRTSIKTPIHTTDQCCRSMRRFRRTCKRGLLEYGKVGQFQGLNDVRAQGM